MFFFDFFLLSPSACIPIAHLPFISFLCLPQHELGLDVALRLHTFGLTNKLISSPFWLKTKIHVNIPMEIFD